jgi:hypothetical protein
VFAQARRGAGLCNLSKSVRKSQQINSAIKGRGEEKKFTETGLKNAEKG